MTDEKACCTLHGMTFLAIVILLAAGAVFFSLKTAKPTDYKPTIVVNTQDNLARNTITVSGNSQLSVTPDLAMAYVSVVTEDNHTAKAAQEENRIISSRVQDALKQWGANGSDIETQTYSLERLQYWNSDENRYVEQGYKLTHTLKVTTKRINDLGTLVDAAVGAGANGVDQVTFDLSKETQRKVREEALVMASEAAQAKAQVLASSTGVKRGKVVSIQEQNYYYSPFQYNAKSSMDMAAGAPPTQISPQKVEVTSTVQMVFEIG